MKKIEDKYIEQIFKEVREIMPQTLNDDWFFALRDDAYSHNQGWVDQLRGFIRGLWAAEVITLEDVDDIEKILKNNGLL